MGCSYSLSEISVSLMSPRSRLLCFQLHSSACWSETSPSFYFEAHYLRLCAGPRISCERLCGSKTDLRSPFEHLCVREQSGANMHQLRAQCYEVRISRPQGWRPDDSSICSAVVSFPRVYLAYVDNNPHLHEGIFLCPFLDLHIVLHGIVISCNPCIP